MNTIIFDLFDPSIGSEIIQAGIKGILIALESLPSSQKVFTWRKTNTTLEVQWKGSFQESWQFLLDNAYKFDNEILTLPSSKVPIHEHVGLLKTTLAIPATRKVTGKKEIKVLTQEGERIYQTIGVEITQFNRALNNKFISPKGELREKVEVNSTFLPNMPGGIDLKGINALSCLFSPLAWGFYAIKKPVYKGKELDYKYSMALICPLVLDLGLEICKPSVVDFLATSLEDACYHFAWINNENFLVHGYEYFAENKNRAPKIINIFSTDAHPEYQKIREAFPNKTRTENQELQIFVDPLRKNICSNLRQEKPWYYLLGDTIPADTLTYSAKGIRKMFK